MKNRISNLLRILLSLLLIISAALKFYNISGFANTVQMFADAYIIGMPHSIVYFFSVFICFIELFVGTIGIFNRFRTISLPLIIIMSSVFTLVTFANVFFPTSLGSIQDCKCFGDVLHLSPFASFIKSCVLLCLSLLALYFLYHKETATNRILSMIITLGLLMPCFAFSTLAQEKKRKLEKRALVLRSMTHSLTSDYLHSSPY